ncbi:MAG: hypothetical protein JOS17DRAFT_787583 [Linnemannia elongata]|nr:MAG: hypothetical protein JOS17DRAFT_787583 [Linnemannia elongata]
MSHAQLAHYLCIQETVPQEFYQIHFPRLVVFHLGNLNQLTKSKGVFWNSAKFFRLNLTIQDVIIRSENVSSNKCFGPEIWNAWSRYEEIECGGGSLESGYRAEVLEGSSRLKCFKVRSGGPAWPHLEDLNLEKFEGSDEKIATWLFWHLRLLKDLRLDRGHLGLFCFDLREQQFVDFHHYHSPTTLGLSKTEASPTDL